MIINQESGEAKDQGIKPWLPCNANDPETFMVTYLNRKNSDFFFLSYCSAKLSCMGTGVGQAEHWT